MYSKRVIPLNSLIYLLVRCILGMGKKPPGIHGLHMYSFDSFDLRCESVTYTYTYVYIYTRIHIHSIKLLPLKVICYILHFNLQKVYILQLHIT